MLHPLDTVVLKRARRYVRGPHLRKYTSRKICICDTYLETRITKLNTIQLAAAVYSTGYIQKHLYIGLRVLTGVLCDWK